MTTCISLRDFIKFCCDFILTPSKSCLKFLLACLIHPLHEKFLYEKKIITLKVGEEIEDRRRKVASGVKGKEAENGWLKRENFIEREREESYVLIRLHDVDDDTVQVLFFRGFSYSPVSPSHSLTPWSKNVRFSVHSKSIKNPIGSSDFNAWLVECCWLKYFYHWHWNLRFYYT